VVTQNISSKIFGAIFYAGLIFLTKCLTDTLPGIQSAVLKLCKAVWWYTIKQHYASQPQSQFSMVAYC